MKFLTIFDFEERQVYRKAYPRRSKGPSRLHCMSYPPPRCSKCNKHLGHQDGGCKRHHHRLHTAHDGITVKDVYPRARNMEMVVSINRKISLSHTHTQTQRERERETERFAANLKDKAKITNLQRTAHVARLDSEEPVHALTGRSYRYLDFIRM